MTLRAIPNGFIRNSVSESTRTEIRFLAKAFFFPLPYAESAFLLVEGEGRFFDCVDDDERSGIDLPNHFVDRRFLALNFHEDRAVVLVVDPSRQRVQPCRALCRVPEPDALDASREPYSLPDFS